jgi:hypothetical protein
MRALILRTALAVFTVATLGGCVTISERAWANGQAMSASREYRQAMSGDMSLQTMRSLHSSADPRRLHSPVRWTPSRDDR